MHWAAHGHTADEVIIQRADASKPNMGLTSWTGNNPAISDIKYAKNYLTENELDVLNRIVTIYLDFAELQALNRKPMYMKDWIVKLDDFLKTAEREILTHAGTVSNEKAIKRARAEYEKYKATLAGELALVEQHFITAVSETKKIEAANKRK